MTMTRRRADSRSAPDDDRRSQIEWKMRDSLSCWWPPFFLTQDGETLVFNMDDSSDDFAATLGAQMQSVSLLLILVSRTSASAV